MSFSHLVWRGGSQVLGFLGNEPGLGEIVPLVQDKKEAFLVIS